MFKAAMNNVLDGIPMDLAAQQLEDVIPHSDEGGSPLSVQAQAAILCTLCAVRILAGERGDEVIVEAANSVVDALDNYTFFIAETISGRTDSPDDYELLGRECARQLQDCEFLCHGGVHDLSALLKWRIENRQYAVPPAVSVVPTRIR